MLTCAQHNGLSRANLRDVKMDGLVLNLRNLYRSFDSVANYASNQKVHAANLPTGGALTNHELPSPIHLAYLGKLAQTASTKDCLLRLTIPRKARFTVPTLPTSFIVILWFLCSRTSE